MHIACFYRKTNLLNSPTAAFQNRFVPRRFITFLLAFVVTATSFSVMPASAEDKEPHGLAVPAEFIRNIQVPGQGEQILRPSTLHYDRFHNEVLIGDPGHNRILIFTAGGAYKFEFSLNEAMTSPRDVATDSQGYIYVAGSDPRGPQIWKFDFDGTPIEALPLPLGDDGVITSISSIAVGQEDQLFCLEPKVGLIHEFSSQLVYNRSFPVAVNDKPSPEKSASEVLGRLAVAGDELLLPVSSAGTVVRMDNSGRYLGSIGYFGAKAGTLNFPVAVEVSPEGFYLIMDTGRFCVVCYAEDGQVLGEFGGKGLSPGWFINPTLLCVSSADQVMVGQIFHNKIQACLIPEFIRLGNSQRRAMLTHETVNRANRAPDGRERRSASVSSNNVEKHREIGISQNNHHYSHLEVSE